MKITIDDIPAAKDSWSDFIPLLQSFVWPLFILTLIALFLRQYRAEIPKWIAQLSDIVGKGGTLEVGPSGVKLSGGQARQIDDTEIASEGRYVPVTDESVKNALAESTQSTTDDDPTIYLLHSAKRDSSLDRDGLAYHRFRFWIDCDVRKNLDDVESVTYILHPSFKNRFRSVKDRATLFGLNTIGWGEFLLRARVSFTTPKPPVMLERYITLGTVESASNNS